MSDSFLIQAISEMVPHGSRVLDLGCGDGSLLTHLQNRKGCLGYGVEINHAKVVTCILRGINVIQFNLEAGLSIFNDHAFDVVLQIDTLPHLRNAEVMLRETARVGRIGIVAFSNFAHWPNRWSVLNGRMPMTPFLPYPWYETPNIRVGTHASFLARASKNGCTMEDHFGLHNGRVIRTLPNWRASKSVFKFRRTENKGTVLGKHGASFVSALQA